VKRALRPSSSGPVAQQGVHFAKSDIE
jgi:hypothetical protein